MAEPAEYARIMAAPADVIPRRPTLLFIVVLGLLFILMSLSTRTRYIGETRTMFERSVMILFSPVPKTVNWVGQHDRRHLPRLSRHAPRRSRENLQLHRDSRLSSPPRTSRLRQSEGDLRRLRSLLGYSEQFTHADHRWPSRSCSTPRSRFKSIILDRGSNAGIEVNDAVVNANGLIGRVVLTTKDMAKVQLVTDGNSLGRRAGRAHAPAGRAARRRRQRRADCTTSLARRRAAGRRRHDRRHRRHLSRKAFRSAS